MPDYRLDQRPAVPLFLDLEEEQTIQTPAPAGGRMPKLAPKSA